jgi:hypothetical protein
LRDGVHVVMPESLRVWGDDEMMKSRSCGCQVLLEASHKSIRVIRVIFGTACFGDPVKVVSCCGWNLTLKGSREERQMISEGKGRKARGGADIVSGLSRSLSGLYRNVARNSGLDSCTKLQYYKERQILDDIKDLVAKFRV